MYTKVLNSINQIINNMKRRITFLTRASMMLFAVLFSFTSARAQQSLPYEYGFETALADEGWTTVDCHNNTGINNSEKYEGSSAFRFFYSKTPPQYLISPEFDGATAVNMTFWYKAQSSNYTETFQVGYSTTTNDVSEFTWGDEMATNNTSWQQYEAEFPVGTKYVAISYNSNDQYYLFLDNFSFKVPSAVAKPTGLKVNYEGGTEATVSWSSDASAFDIDVNDVVTENVSNPYTLTGLELGTTYSIKVRAKEGTDVSDWTAPVSFTTEYGVFSLPYEEGFENGLDAWTLVDCASGSKIVSGSSYAHEGNSSFKFTYNTTPPQYLISPEFDGASAMTVSFWYKTGGASYPETFQIGYSTTTKDVNEFTWGDEVEATNNTEWLQYEVDFPASTKYVAVRLNSNDKLALYLDDFSFIVNNGVAKPTGLKVSEIGAKTALLSWAENGEATAWEICLNGDEENLIAADSNPFTLTGLTPETDYTAKVRAVSGDLKSGWSNEVAFTTDVEFPAPTDLAVVPAAKTAEISWTGNAEATGYNLRYKESGAGVGAGGEFVSDFEDSSMGEWTTIDADGDGYNWVLGSACGGIYLVEGGSLAGTGNGGSEDFVVSGSYSNVAGALSPDNWLVSPLVTLGGSISFYAGGQDATYSNEYFGVFVSTTSNTDPAAFTQLDAWTLQADGTGVKSSRRRSQGVWGLFTVDLSAYAGQTGYVAIRHFNCTDQFMLNIDDITIVQPGGGEEEPWTVVEGATSPYTISGLTPETKYQVQVQAVYGEGESKWTAKSFTTLEDVPAPANLVVSEVAKRSAVLNWTENGEATAWEICLNNDEENLIAADSNPFTVEGLTPETEYTAKVRAINGEKKSRWSAPVSFTTEIAWPVPTDLAADNITSNSAEISWTADATATGAELKWAEGDASGVAWYQYDNGTLATTIGTGSAFYWAVMFPAGSYTGTTLSKIAVYDPKAMTGTITIYNDGDSAPENAVGSVPVTFTGAADFIEVDVNATIDPTKNVWVVIYNESGTDYPASASADTTNDPNGRWVSTDGSSWMDVASAGLSGYSWMIHAEIGTPVDPSTFAWTTVDDATSPYELTGLNPETTYTVQVKSIYEDGESQWTTTIFTTLSNNPVPYDIAADLAADGATLTWEGEGESYNVQYRTAALDNALFTANFSDGWTIYTEGDAAGAWTLSSGSMIAHSWTSSAGSLNADNWLISPAVELDGTLKFTVGVEDAYADSYEVLLSTTGIDIADFTTILQAMAPGTNGQEVSIDLSAYAGQTGYIAIHHVDNDMNYLAISNLAIYESVPAGAWENMAVTEKTATISGLATNSLYEYQIQSVKGDKTSEWSKLADFALLTLDSEADNSDLINTYNGKQAHVTLANRTFYKDGKWNTIYLPFDMTLDQVTASPLADADIRTLTNNITDEGDYVMLNFTAEGEALTTWGGNMFFGGVPYIAKWNEGSDIVNPEFANVTITNAQYFVGDQNSVMFVGTYAPIEFDADDTSVLFVNANNKLNYPQAGATIGAFRGYLQLVGMTAESGSGVKFYTNLDDDATGIAKINDAKDSGEWYDLSGRKLASKPNMKGIFIVNGKKVLK